MIKTKGEIRMGLPVFTMTVSEALRFASVLVAQANTALESGSTSFTQVPLIHSETGEKVDILLDITT